MGRARIIAFDVGAGDCIFLTLDNGENKFSIMVDCGDYKSSVKEFVINELHNSIDLLIITHIDNDHIDGVKEMMEDENPPKIKRILFNCAQLIRPDILPESLPDNIDLSKIVGKQSKGYKLIHPVNAKGSLSLASIISENAAYIKAWSSQQEYITAATEDLLLPEGFGKLIFLSPEEDSIKKLDNEFKKAFIQSFYMRYGGPYENESSIYELIIGGLSEYYQNKKYTSNSSLSITSLENLLNRKDEKRTISPANKASIAFIWECYGKRVLFCGDADPEIIVYNYLCKNMRSLGGYETFEAIKVPHHGSSHNCDSHFWETFDSSHIFITGYSKNGDRPSKECLARIVFRPTEDCRILHYTHKNDTLEWCDSNQEVCTHLNYRLTDQTFHEFEY